MFGGTFTLGPLKLRARQYLFTRDNRIYVITCAGLESQWERYRGEVEASVADEVIEKLVTHRAVVCDLCSSLPGRTPACVHACPHDAALRVDARFNFPSR